MKVTYIRIADKDSGEFDVPEIDTAVDDFIANFNKEFSVNNGLFIGLPENQINNDTESEMIIIGEDVYTKELIKMFEDFDRILELKDISKEVKTGTCNLPAFLEIFLSEGCVYNNTAQLNEYLYKYTTIDDVLDKISLLGIESLNENEQDILKEKSVN